MIRPLLQVTAAVGALALIPVTTGAMASVDAAAIAAATNVRVVMLSDCDDAAAGASAYGDALAANAAVATALQGSSATAGNVVAVAMENDTLVLYVEDSTETNQQGDAGTTSGSTSTTTTTTN